LSHTDIQMMLLFVSLFCLN